MLRCRLEANRLTSEPCAGASYQLPNELQGLKDRKEIKRQRQPEETEQALIDRDSMEVWRKKLGIA